MRAALAGLAVLLLATPILAEEKAPAERDFSQLPLNTWVKLSPLETTPFSPQLGYEGACAWDSRHQRLIRYGGHNQGGGGEQHAEVWSFDPRTAAWKFHEPNTSPPGICCGQQNVFDPIAGRYVRFAAFSASHGWQWLREVYLNDTSSWTYDLAENRWRNMRPYPTPRTVGLRCATWDSRFQAIVVFGGENATMGTWVYDPYDNSWTDMRPKPEPERRSGGNMAYDRRQQKHILFGAQFLDDPHTWSYDLATNTWRDLQPATMPPTRKNDAVLTYDAQAGAVVALIKVTSGEGDDQQHHLETWTFDVAQNKWTKLNPLQEPDPTGDRARQLMYAPELGVTLLENRTHRYQGKSEQQIWALRLPPAPAEDRPAAPEEIAIAVADNTARISWQGDGEPSAKPSFAVYRAAAAHPWEGKFERVATVAQREYVDEAPARDQPTFYCVTRLDAAGRESEPSRIVRTQPPLVDGVVVHVESAERISITWDKSRSDEVVGYLVERAPVEVWSDDQIKRIKEQTPPLDSPSACRIRRVGQFVRLTDKPITEPRYVDTSIDLRGPSLVEGEPLDEPKFYEDQLDRDGRPYRFGVYAYRVRAVNKLGIASGASAAMLTIPSSPQDFFAREEGEKCHLRWNANPEAGIRGYRIYRMDGRYNKDPITRLTPEPVDATTFTDAQAGKATRRYYVVAVDALGQEGFPSSPVWFQREWQPFYQPFTGEWHQ